MNDLRRRDRTSSGVDVPVLAERSDGVDGGVSVDVETELDGHGVDGEAELGGIETGGGPHEGGEGSRDARRLRVYDSRTRVSRMLERPEEGLSSRSFPPDPQGPGLSILLPLP